MTGWPADREDRVEAHRWAGEGGIYDLGLELEVQNRRGISCEYDLEIYEDMMAD